MSHDEELSPPMTMKMEKGIKVQKWRLQTLEHDALVSKKILFSERNLEIIMVLWAGCVWIHRSLNENDQQNMYFM